ncbi:RNA-binding protein [Phanerochaete sordida]|uniref:RNA-binding protein n=1 Tax=Phanerochaete sordida TaxID=48140 RepID=A0A9P3LFF2_9APHY|nr:RNA-binding protein [Phanerochaete sordida]
MTVPILYPHPLVTSSVLYVRDVPVRVKWDNLVATLRTCGDVAQVEVTRAKGAGKKNGCRTWAVGFTDIAHAELALATLRGAPIAGLPDDAPWPLTLFISAHPSHKDEPSASWALPQYTERQK